MVTKDFVSDLFNDTYGRTAKNIAAFHGNFSQVACKIKPGTNVFIGQLRICPQLFFEKLPAYVDQPHRAESELVTKLFGNFDEYLLSNNNLAVDGALPAIWFPNGFLAEWNNIIFDDLGFIKYAAPGFYTRNKMAGEMTEVNTPFVSLARFVKDSNGGRTETLAPQLAADPTYNYAPQYLSFTGYIVNIGN